MNYKYEEIKEHFTDALAGYDEETISQLVNDGELHHEVFNTDYYIIGYYKARQWMGDKAFEIIGYIKDYEMDNFGEVYTDLSSEESVVNMYTYIIGEQIVADYMESVTEEA